MKQLTIFVILTMLLVPTFNQVYPHGLGSEIFPPVNFNGQNVTVEVISSQNDPDNTSSNNDRQISISLIDFDSKSTLSDVTFFIKSELGNEFLFEQEFKANDGFLVFNFKSREINSINVIEKDPETNFFGSLLGLESRQVDVEGPKLSIGGLYKFNIQILGAEGYSNMLKEPLVFNAGISIPQTTTHNFIDPNFGDQYIKVITYYDKISNFDYDYNSKQISFFMPFEWSEININQTSVVHEEIIIPKTFGDLLVSEFAMYVNNIKIDNNVITIDDYTSNDRLVHFIIHQKELLNIFENASNLNDGMNFVIKPEHASTRLSSVTDNGQYRIYLFWEPENLKSGNEAKLMFNVTDIFLKNLPIATNYELSITQNDQIIFEQSGISTDSRDESNIAELIIPDNIKGVVNVNFYNLDNNEHAKTSIPIVINRVFNNNDISEILIPNWVKNIASWWLLDQIDNDTFIHNIEYLIDNEVIVISQIPQKVTDSQTIPAWFKTNVTMWTSNTHDDNTMIQDIKTLIIEGIIRVN